MKPIASLTARALTAGAICLVILGGMMIAHAWPLWNGHTILLPVTTGHSLSPVRGERVTLQTPANRIFVSDDANALAPQEAVRIRPAAGWPRDLADDYRERRRRLRGRLVYVQFEPIPDANWQHRPVSVSLKPVDNAVNIRGRIYPTGSTFHVDFGLDPYYVPEGTASHIAEAIQQRRQVEMEVAVAASGRPRIRRLLIDGTPFGR